MAVVSFPVMNFSAFYESFEMVTIPDITSLVLVASCLLAVSLWGKFRPLRPRFVLHFSVVGYRVLRVCVGRYVFEHFAVALQVSHQVSPSLSG